MSKKAKKERKFTTLTAKYQGRTFHKSVSYYSARELAEKQQAFEASLQLRFSEKFCDVAERWQEDHSKNVETYTQSCYKAPVKDLKTEFGDRMMQDIDTLSFQAYLDKLARQGFARQTVNLRKIAMKQIFDYAIAHQLVIYNPITVCKVPKKAKKPVTRVPPSDNDVELIRSHPDGTFGLYCNLLLYTGLRREEALALTYDDIDFLNKTISVSKVVVFDGNIPSVRDSAKSDAGSRIVPLLAPAESILAAAEEKSGLLFPGKNGLMKKGEFDKGFNKYKAATGISCTSHQLRHYFASLCFEAELKENDVKDLMGHSNIALTHEVYTHISKRRKKESTEMLNQFLSAKSVTA